MEPSISAVLHSLRPHKQKVETKQINTLIYMMGDAADDTLKSFKLSEDSEKICHSES